MQHRSLARARAFTILELMISTVLMTVLLAGTWALLGIYQGQFEKSQDRVERWQLIRSLQNQLTDDLQACHVPAHESAAIASASNADTRLTPGLSRDAESTESPVSATATPEAGPSETGMPGPENVVDASVGIDVAAAPAPLILEKWMHPAAGLEGTRDVLILDILAPKHPGAARNVAGPNPGDQVTRVVYSFVDPVRAASEGRRAGLVRCQWKAHELQSLFLTNTGSVDLHALVNQIKSPPHTFREAARVGESMADDAGSAAASKLSLLGLETVDMQGLDDDVGQRIDLVPELTSLVFSYYDGHQWHSSWSFSQRGYLPVAVEMRFDLARPKSAALQEADPSVVAQQLLRDRNEVPVALDNPTTDRIRSSQTAPPVGYRWLIYLGDQHVGEHVGELRPLEQEVFPLREGES